MLRQQEREAQRIRALAEAYLKEKFPLICPEEILVLLEENGAQIFNLAKKRYLKRTIKHGGMFLFSLVGTALPFVWLATAPMNPTLLFMLFDVGSLFAGVGGLAVSFAVALPKFLESLLFWRYGEL